MKGVNLDTVTVTVACLLIIAFIIAAIVTTTDYRQRQDDCRAAGGTPVADTCYAPGVVIEP